MSILGVAYKELGLLGGYPVGVEKAVSWAQVLSHPRRFAASVTRLMAKKREA